MKDSWSLPLPVVVEYMRPRDRGKPQERLAPRPEALHNPQISRTVRGVRPENRRSNATHTADALNNNLQLVNCLNLAEAVRIGNPYRQDRILPNEVMSRMRPF